MWHRHIDCASAYSNEDTVGKTFQEVFAEGNISRDDIWVTSKLFNKDHARVRDACQQTLKDLQLEQLDLYLMHWPAVSGCEGPTLKPSIKVCAPTPLHLHALCNLTVCLSLW